MCSLKCFTIHTLSPSEVLLQILSQGYVFWQQDTRRTFEFLQVGNLWPSLFLPPKRWIFSRSSRIPIICKDSDFQTV